MGGYKQKGSTIAIKSLKKVSDRKFQTTAGNHKPIMAMKKMAYSALILSLLQYFLGEKNKKNRENIISITYYFILRLVIWQDLTMEPI